MENKLRSILKFIIGIVIFSALGWVYFMGITCPTYEPPINAIYRGIGCGMIYPLYFLLIPPFVNKFVPDIRYSGIIVSAVSFVLSVILFFITCPLQT